MIQQAAAIYSEQIKEGNIGKTPPSLLQNSKSERKSKLFHPQIPSVLVLQQVFTASPPLHWREERNHFRSRFDWVIPFSV